MARDDRPPFVRQAREQHPGRTVELWYQDEARVGQKGSLTRVWAARGSRPRAVRQTDYGYTYLFGAACGTTGASVALVLPHADTAMMNLFLREMSSQLAPHVHAVLVVDNAGWHRSRGLSVPQNISLLFLPPYAPELNPMERVWRQLKHRHLSNREFADEEAVVEACAEAWNLLTPDQLQSLFGTQATLDR